MVLSGDSSVMLVISIHGGVMFCYLNNHLYLFILQLLDIWYISRFFAFTKCLHEYPASLLVQQLL